MITVNGVLLFIAKINHKICKCSNDLTTASPIGNVFYVEIPDSKNIGLLKDEIKAITLFDNPREILQIEQIVSN